MAQTTQEIIDGATCLDCAIPLGLQLPVLIYVFARAAGVSTDPQTLVDNAACISACIPPGMQLAALLGIQASGGGGGSGCALSTNGDPEGVLTSTCTPAIAIDPNTLALYVYTGLAGGNTGWTLKV